jgi:hypothetical protein
MSHTIDDFWVPRLQGIIHPSAGPSVPGWSNEVAPNPSFVEAALNLRAGYDELSSPVWFVAASGAVGKSTLAREISARTGATYLDLAKADTVAGNYLTGGLVKNNMLAAWNNGQAALLVDALDEARLRVTQSSFEDFLSDVITLTRNRRLPTVFFGRVGMVEEAWLLVSEQGLVCPIFDIDFFDTPRAKRFVVAALIRLAAQPRYAVLATSLAAHRTVYEDAAGRFVAGLEDATGSDGARFAGYAPVLEAVATVLAEVTNPAGLSEALQEAMQGQILQQLADQILAREATKLRAQLPPEISEITKAQLYTPDEQLARLTAIILATPAPAAPIELKPQQMAAYDTAVTSFITQHPCLDGSGQKPSGAVFSALINAHALFSSSPETRAAAQTHAAYGPQAPNPFLVDFYLHRLNPRADHNPVLAPEHVVLLHESVRARAGNGENVALTIEGDEESDEADVEIEIVDRTQASRRILLRTSQAGAVRFGRQVNRVFVDSPHLDVIIGSGNPVEMVAPVTLNIARLSFDCPELVIRRNEVAATEEGDAAVVLEAQELAESKILSVPLVRKGAELAVSWPGASSYPWDRFVFRWEEGNGRDIEDALRGLRRLVLAFRSHGRGRLARIKDKVESARMTKGDLGVAIRHRLMQDGIILLEGSMYFLNSNNLGKTVGATYQDLNLKRFNDKVRSYVSTIV